MRVANKKCIRRLSIASFKAAKLRNIITVTAIALTTILFTVIFTVGMSIKQGFELSNFRQVGGYEHGGFKYLTAEQVEEIKSDPLIKEYGLRLVCGMPAEPPFHKSHVEVSYCDENTAKWMFMEPVEGRYPREGTNEAATDLRVLSLLGVEPVIGSEFTMTFLVDGEETTETFTLCGYWEYDDVTVANHVLIPQSRVEEIFDKLDTQGRDGMTTYWNLDVMFQSSANIAKNMETILEERGYQSEDRGADNYIATGVNWGYAAAQLADSMDFGTMLALFAAMLLVIFTGYLIIYNIFQISVSNDVRFYGLLKTVGTTGKQIRKLILLQALLLSAIGIPVGLIVGWGAGVLTTRIVVEQLESIILTYSVNPIIFLGAAAFSLITVWLSLKKPRKMAARISPVEAVRYTEGQGSRKARRKGEKGASIFKMAWANLGRNKSKTVITVISLSFAVVLLNITYTFATGFDMDKYLNRINVDFIVSDAGYFQLGPEIVQDAVFPKEEAARIEAMEGVTGGRVYRQTFKADEYVTEEWVRQIKGQWNSADVVDQYVETVERKGDLLAEQVKLYGMEDFVLDKIHVVEGDISKLKGEGKYVAAVYMTDDYNNVEWESHWAKVGDQVTIRYVEESEYYNPDTGVVYDEDQVQELWKQHVLPYNRATKYREETYEVAALITVPNSLTYRYYGADEFVMGADTFVKDSGTDNLLYYAFDCEDDSVEAMEQWMQEFAGGDGSQYNYESKKTYEKEFNDFRNMFMMLGMGASAIVGLVGILNFLNAILTSITARRREFAVLQSVGMTGRQLTKMLMIEGMAFVGSSVVITLVLSVAAGPLASRAMESMFWFFSYHLTVTPIILVAPVFLALGAGIPWISYHYVAKKSVVERLREAE